MLPKFDHIHNTIVKKIDVFFTMSRDRNSKVATVERLYQDIINLYMQSTPDFLLNEWLDDDDCELTFDALEFVSTRQYAEDCLMKMMATRQHMPSARLLELYSITAEKV